MDPNAELRFDTSALGPGKQTPERLKRQLSRLMGMTGAQMRKIANEAMGAVGANKDHFVVLAALAEFGPASQAALSDRTRVYRSDLVAVLNDLADGGWIRRDPDPGDKRRNIITITEAGAERLAELDVILEGVNERIMAPLDHTEREQLFALLGRINAHLAAGGSRPAGSG